MDCSKFGEEFAIQHYGNHRFFNVNWIETEKEAINRRAKLYTKAKEILK